MRICRLLALAGVPPLLALACTSDLPAPDNYQESGISATATDTGGDVAVSCEDIPDAALLAQYDYTPSADGGEGSLMWEQQGLPDGLVIDQTTGQISGTPEAEGPVTVMLTVTDAEGATGSETCEFEVHPALDVELELLVMNPPFCVRPGDTLLGLVVDGTGDGSLIECDTPGGSGNGTVPDGISVNPDTCEFEGTLTEDRYGTYVFMVRGTQSGREVWVPYCITQDQQEPNAYMIDVDHSGLAAMNVDATLLPIVRTFDPNQSFSVGEPGDPLFTVTDPTACGNSCFYGFAFSINASPFDTSGDNFNLVTGDMLIDDGMGNPIGLEHGIFIDGPGPQVADEFAERYGDRPWVVNFGLDYCLSDMDGPCEGAQNIRDNGLGTLESAILMFPE